MILHDLTHFVALVRESRAAHGASASSPGRDGPARRVAQAAAWPPEASAARSLDAPGVVGLDG